MLDSDSSRSAELPAEGGTSRLSREEIFELLGASRRREVLRYLDSHDGTADIGSLAEHVAAREIGAPRSQVEPSERKRVYVGLYQFHLPRMTAYDVVAFDEETGEVELLDAAGLLLPYLRLDPMEDSTYFERESGP